MGGWKSSHRTEGDVAANFLYRTIEVAEWQTITASFGSDDAIKVYLNGKQCWRKTSSEASLRIRILSI